MTAPRHRRRLRLPEGRLVRDRVVDGPRPLLADALDRDLTGYAVVRPQSSLLLDADDAGVLTFEAGVPVVAYHGGTDRGGPPALADLGPGPFRVELRALPPEEPGLARVNGADDLRVPPGAPAERLAGDRALADRTRAVAPEQADATAPAPDRSAVEAFLADEERIAAIKEQARAEARAQKAAYGLEDVGSTSER